MPSRKPGCKRKFHFNQQLDKLAASGLIEFKPDQEVAARGTTYQATLTGSGAISQGGGPAVGERGVYVGGQNTGSINTLHLHVTVRIRLPHGEERKDHPVVDRIIQVDVDSIYSIKKWIADHWQWLLGTLVIPLIAWIWAKLQS